MSIWASASSLDNYPDRLFFPPATRLPTQACRKLTKDPSVLSVIQKLAESDPTKLPGQADGGKDLYPVRLAAQRALTSIGGRTHDPAQPQ